jgi:hypothetical protein
MKNVKSILGPPGAAARHRQEMSLSGRDYGLRTVLAPKS